MYQTHDRKLQLTVKQHAATKNVQVSGKGYFLDCKADFLQYLSTGSGIGVVRASLQCLVKNLVA